MSKPSERKRKKQQARQKQNKLARRRAEERQRYVDSFPQFVFADKNDAPDDFVDLIRSATRKVDLRDRSRFSEPERAFWRDFKKRGGTAIDELVVAGREDPTFPTYLICNLGQTVFNLVPKDELLRWIPFSDVQFLPKGKEIRVAFRSLRRHPGPGGTIYYSRHRPTIEIDGQERVVGFSRHAIEQTCKRISPRWFRYAGLGDAFAFFDQCCHFERYDLHREQLAFTFFDRCAKGFFSAGYVVNVLGRDVEPNDRFYFRVGYCPAVIENDFIKAKTLLFPGFSNTPEFGAVLESNVTSGERTELIKRSRKLSAQALQDSCDFSLIKLFHDSGIPQVVMGEDGWYASPL